MSKKAIWVFALLIGTGAGGLVGFILGAATSDFGRSLIEDSLATEKLAVTDYSQTISRKHFVAKFPANWVEDTEMEYYEPEHYFLVNSPGGNWIQLEVLDYATDPAVNVQEYERTEVIALKEVTKTTFTRWGQYTGKGIELKGKRGGFYPVRVRIFSYSSKAKSFTIFEHHSDEDEELIKPGFDLVEKTFQLKGA